MQAHDVHVRVHVLLFFAGSICCLPGCTHTQRNQLIASNTRTDRQTDRQSVIKLRVVGSSPTGVHFFFHFLSITQMIRQSVLPPSYTNQGLVVPDFINHFVD